MYLLQVCILCQNYLRLHNLKKIYPKFELLLISTMLATSNISSFVVIDSMYVFVMSSFDDGWVGFTATYFVSLKFDADEGTDSMKTIQDRQ